MQTELKIALDTINSCASKAVEMGQALDIPGWDQLSAILAVGVQTITVGELGTEAAAPLIATAVEMQEKARDFFAANPSAAVTQQRPYGRPPLENAKVMDGWLTSLATHLGKRHHVRA